MRWLIKVFSNNAILVADRAVVKSFLRNDYCLCGYQYTSKLLIEARQMSNAMSAYTLGMVERFRAVLFPRA